MATTQQQVAELAGVTRATVSYVLGGRAEELRITDAVAERVRRAARQLGYSPHHAARVLVSGKTMTLGLLLGDAAGHVAPFWSVMAEGVEAEALEAGYDVLLLRAHGEPTETGLRSLRERRVDGLIALGQAAGAGADAWRDSPVPPVVIQAFGPPGLPSVGLDSRPGIDAAVAHLLELGHRRLMWIGPERGVGHRGTVLAACAKARGLAAEICDLGEVSEPFSRPDDQIGFWYETLGKALPDVMPATAVFCWNDRAALGLYALFRQRGLRVPEDVSVIGFDDHEAALALPPLSTVSHEFRRMGAEASRLAMRLADGSVPRAEAAEATIRVPSRFVPRKSTGPAPSP